MLGSRLTHWVRIFANRDLSPRASFTNFGYYIGAASTWELDNDSTVYLEAKYHTIETEVRTTYIPIGIGYRCSLLAQFGKRTRISADPSQLQAGGGAGPTMDLGLGVGCGLFFGEHCAPLAIAGDAFIGLLQMTVLPYIALSLLVNLGRLSLEKGSKTRGRRARRTQPLHRRRDRRGGRSTSGPAPVGDGIVLQRLLDRPASGPGYSARARSPPNRGGR